MTWDIWGFKKTIDQISVLPYKRKELTIPQKE